MAVLARHASRAVRSVEESWSSSLAMLANRWQFREHFSSILMYLKHKDFTQKDALCLLSLDTWHLMTVKNVWAMALLPFLNDAAKCNGSARGRESNSPVSSERGN